jgi:hypothetical protein
MGQGESKAGEFVYVHGVPLGSTGAAATSIAAAGEVNGPVLDRLAALRKQVPLLQQSVDATSRRRASSESFAPSSSSSPSSSASPSASTPSSSAYYYHAAVAFASSSSTPPPSSQRGGGGRVNSGGPSVGGTSGVPSTSTSQPSLRLTPELGASVGLAPFTTLCCSQSTNL